MIVRPEHFEFDRYKTRETERIAHDQTLSQEQRHLISHRSACCGGRGA